MDRRRFLASLAALGAAVTLPEDATSAQVDAAWEQALRDPWTFEVTGARTIVEADAQEPRIRGDVYQNVSSGWVNTPDDLVCEVEQHEELRSRFATLAADEFDVVESRLEDEDVTGAERERLLALRAALRDGEHGWEDWVRLEGPAGLPRFRREIDAWLAEPVDWMQSEFWPRGWGGQGRALEFFEQLDGDIADDLGIVIVEGEHPGSTYYAAELHAPIAQANAAAERLGLPFRFRADTA